jgi:hypothetical protein
MKMKISAVALALTSLLSMKVHASELAEPSQLISKSAPAFSQADLHTLFGNLNQPVQLAVLSKLEMKQTEGAWVPIAVGAAAGGFYNGISYYNATNNRTVAGWSTAIGSGVVGGAVGGIRWWSAPIWGGGIGLTGGWAAPRFTQPGR